VTGNLTGNVVQVSVSQGGVPKLPVPSAELTEVGIAGDTWRYPFHGGRRRAILLVTGEGIDELIAQGFSLFPGALGENLTTRGLERHELRIGQRLQVGDAQVELTQIRTPCATLDVYGPGVQAAMYDAQAQAGDSESPRWGLSGFYASVVRPGTVRAGDTIASAIGYFPAIFRLEK
jgi:MOSC domain-containing protein YiiM